MRYIKYGLLGIALIFMFVFIYSYMDSKKKETYTDTPKELVKYENSLQVAKKAQLLINLRTESDYEELERIGKMYLSDDLYNQYMSTKGYANSYRKDIIEDVTIKGTMSNDDNFIFKLVLTRNGLKETHLIYVSGGVITKLRSLGDV